MNTLVTLSPFVLLPLIVVMYGIQLSHVVITGVTLVPVAIGLYHLHKWDIRRRRERV